MLDLLSIVLLGYFYYLIGAMLLVGFATIVIGFYNLVDIGIKNKIVKVGFEETEA